MKIAIMSDSHDAWENLEKAILKANGMDSRHLLFAGDFISPPGLKYLSEFKGKTVFVWGNNDGEIAGLTRQIDIKENIELAGDIYEGEIDGIRVFMNHYPRISELAAELGKFDLCIHGHTHDCRLETVGETTLVNPGEIQGFKTGKPSFAIYDTSTKQVERIDII